MVRPKIPDKETLRLLKPQVKYIKQKFNPKKIILFGSRARGDNFITSDIDLIVVSEKFQKVNFHDRMVLAYGNWGQAIDLEVLCYTPEEFEQKKREIGIVQQAVKEGVEIS